MGADTLTKRSGLWGRFLTGEPRMSWTDERVETLKKMWGEGQSASQIAKELGGVTRNAVIGKVHRLGLSNRTAGAPAAKPEPKAKPAAEPSLDGELLAEPAGGPDPEFQYLHRFLLLAKARNIPVMLVPLPTRADFETGRAPDPTQAEYQARLQATISAGGGTLLQVTDIPGLGAQDFTDDVHLSHCLLYTSDAADE